MPTAIVSLSEFKAKAAQMLAEMKSAEHEIVLTQRGAASAVVQDFETHQRHRKRVAHAEAHRAGRGRGGPFEWSHGRLQCCASRKHA